MVDTAANTTTPEYLATQRPVQRFPSSEIALCMAKDFLSRDECAALIMRIDEKRRPSTIADPNGDPYFRTSESCDLDHDDPIVGMINDRICAFAGIDSAYGEPLQGQRYAEGQEFKAHTDYFNPDGADYAKYCTESGQRTWTFMAYLNEPAAGGATRFVEIGKLIKPRTGMLLCWNNRTVDGDINYKTLHHGMKVRKGTKYVITKWFRERPWAFPPA
ncbi:MAG: 2OG-Fe(II) oxygenase [Parasphingorhabdus sp.]|nr:2OG-Fe(II) oxygenase [Parasphingorhabdus sp.]